jgi:hypothetical protein
MPWPSTIPHDLRVLLQALGQHRDLATDADRWGAIKEWLESHNVPAPNGLPTAPEAAMLSLGYCTELAAQISMELGVNSARLLYQVILADGGGPNDAREL